MRMVVLKEIGFFQFWNKIEMERFKRNDLLLKISFINDILVILIELRSFRN